MPVYEILKTISSRDSLFEEFDEEIFNALAERIEVLTPAYFVVLVEELVKVEGKQLRPEQKYFRIKKGNICFDDEELTLGKNDLCIKEVKINESKYSSNPMSSLPE